MSKASLVRRRDQRSAARHLKRTESTRKQFFIARYLADVEDPPDHDRPRTRAECMDGPRPCPYVGCRYNLQVDVRPSGSIAYSGATETCALDVAEEGSHTLIEVGKIIGVTRERIRQIERKALRKLQANAAVSKHLREAMASAR